MTSPEQSRNRWQSRKTAWMKASAVIPIMGLAVAAPGGVIVQSIASFQRIDLPVDGVFYPVPVVVEARVDPADAGNIFPIDFGDYAIAGIGNGWLSGANLRIPAAVPAPASLFRWNLNLSAMCARIDSPPGGPPNDGPPELHDVLLNAKGTDVMLTGFFFTSTGQAFGTFPDGMGGWSYMRTGCDLNIAAPRYMGPRVFERDEPPLYWPDRPSSYPPPEFLGVYVPEPSSAALLLGGAATLIARRRGWGLRRSA